MKRKSLLIISVFIVTIGAILIINQIINNTTYEKAVSLMLEDNEKVNSIEIEWRVINKDTGLIRKFTTITDENIINKILNEPSQMKLKKKNKLHPGTEYNLLFNTNKGNKGIIFGEGNVQIGNDFYKITGDNLLKEVIINENLDWTDMK